MTNLNDVLGTYHYVNSEGGINISLPDRLYLNKEEHEELVDCLTIKLLNIKAGVEPVDIIFKYFVGLITGQF